MDKKTLIAEIAKRTEFAKWEIHKIVDPLFDVILEALQGGDEVALKNFGKFTLKYQKAKETIHPKTQARIKVPHKASVVFNATRMFSPSEETMDNLVKQLEQR